MPSINDASSSTASKQLEPLSTSLLSSSTPLDARFRALFTLKGLATSNASNAAAVIDILGKGFDDDSALLKHEVAYCLGQLADVRAVPKLQQVVEDVRQDAMVRHEAAEALGAISAQDALPLLKKYAQMEGEDVSVRETCELAIKKIEWDHSEEGRLHRAQEAEVRRKAAEAGAGGHEAFAPIDPAPPALTAKASQSSGQANAAASSESSLDPNAYDVQSLQQQLTDTSRDLFERYRSMFSLRNAVHACLRASESAASRAETSEARTLAHKAEEAVLALASGLDRGAQKSALFRHEICFVFGELSHRASVPAMIATLDDAGEHEMVRHEAAEALGGIAEEAQESDCVPSADAGNVSGDIDQALRVLKKWAQDASAPRVVRESCVVALDEMAYNNDPSQFQPMEAAA